MTVDHSFLETDTFLPEQLGPKISSQQGSFWEVVLPGGGGELH